MNYNLEETEKKVSSMQAIKDLSRYLKDEKVRLILAFIAVILSSAVSVALPFVLGKAVDTYISKGLSDKLSTAGFILLGLFAVNFIASYFQFILMGKVGQDVLYKLRNIIFDKVQFLPIQFFNQNKSGDLISRINNDTSKLNQAFSETLLRFTGSFFTLIGIGIFMLYLDLELALISLASTLVLFVVTRLTAAWVRKMNQKSLQATGNLSGEIQESLSNFKVIVAFNRRDYFKDKFEEANESNRKTATWATIANGILTPIYDYAGNISSMLVLIFGIKFIMDGQVTIGLLISFLSYTERFYQPLRIMASLFTSIQTSLAAWTRISNILSLHNNLEIIEKSEKEESSSLMEFKNVDFEYEDGQPIIKNLNFALEKGQTYALIGPTGGGKSTTASLMSRLYDPTRGEIILKGQNIKAYTTSELTKAIGFILQEPYLFSGTIGDNIKYGNVELSKLSNKDLTKILEEKGLTKILERFKEGLDTKIESSSENLSLGQKQLVAFLRSLMRGSELLILDEATANIDTITENLLQEIINKMPKDTTKVIIAHRLNTIKKADKIFFIANGEMQQALSFDNALELINKKHSNS